MPNAGKCQSLFHQDISSSWIRVLEMCACCARPARKALLTAAVQRFNVYSCHGDNRASAVTYSGLENMLQSPLNGSVRKLSRPESPVSISVQVGACKYMPHCQSHAFLSMNLSSINN